MENNTSHVEEIRITNGQREAVIGQTTEAVQITEDGQRFAKTMTFLQTMDGRTITDPLHDRVILACTSCNKGPLSKFAITYCSKCQHVICRSCAKSFQDSALCQPCYQRARRKWLWNLLTSL